MSWSCKVIFVGFSETILRIKCKICVEVIRFKFTINLLNSKNKCFLFNNKINFNSLTDKLLRKCITVSPIDETWNYL